MDKILSRLLVMAVVCCTSSFFMPISTRAQAEADTSATISIQNQRLMILDAVRKICERTGWSVDPIMDAAGLDTVEVNFSGLTYRQALHEVLDKHGFTFELQGKYLRIMKQVPLTVSRRMKLTGKVVDEHDGQPIYGASVRIKGTLAGAVTDTAGEFVLPGVERGNALSVAAPGYDSRIVTVEGDRGDLKLTKRTLAAAEKTAHFIPGPPGIDRTNVSTIPAEAIAEQAVGNPLLALQGKIPGVYIRQQSGIPGAVPSVQLEGRNTISGLNEPMYIIDGVPLLSGYTFAISGIQGGVGNPLELINVDDIESITALKDADAAAIYGSRAVNGVILVNTKKGAYDSTKLNLKLTNGLGTVTRRLKLLNTWEYIHVREAGYINDGQPVPQPGMPVDQTNADLLQYSHSRNVSWQKVLAGYPSQYMHANMSWARGNYYTNYRIGAGLHRETTVFPGDLSNREATLLMNMNHMSRKDKLKLSLTSYVLTGDNKLIDKDLMQTAVSLAPNAPELYTDNGALNWDRLPNGDASWTNPLSLLDQRYRNRLANFIGASTFSYRIIKRVYLVGNLNYNLLLNKQRLTVPLSSFAPQDRSALQDQETKASDKLHTWLAEPELNYKFSLLGGNVMARVRQVWQHNDGYYNRNWIIGTDNDTSSSSKSVYKYTATGVLLNYDLSQRYQADISLYREKSSRFAAHYQVNYASSIAFGWLFTNEKWLRNHLRFIDSGLLRASYSMLGNDDILRTYGPGEALSEGQAPGSRQDPPLRWGRVNKLAVALHSGIKESGLFFMVNYYRNLAVSQLPDGGLGNFNVRM